jgi:hypothetical protein
MLLWAAVDAADEFSAVAALLVVASLEADVAQTMILSIGLAILLSEWDQWTLFREVQLCAAQSASPFVPFFLSLFVELEVLGLSFFRPVTPSVEQRMMVEQTSMEAAGPILLRTDDHRVIRGEAENASVESLDVPLSFDDASADEVHTNVKSVAFLRTKRAAVPEFLSVQLDEVVIGDSADDSFHSVEISVSVHNGRWGALKGSAARLLVDCISPVIEGFSLQLSDVVRRRNAPNRDRLPFLLFALALLDLEDFLFRNSFLQLWGRRARARDPEVLLHALNAGKSFISFTDLTFFGFSVSSGRVLMEQTVMLGVSAVSASDGRALERALTEHRSVRGEQTPLAEVVSLQISVAASKSQAEKDRAVLQRMMFRAQVARILPDEVRVQERVVSGASTDVTERSVTSARTKMFRFEAGETDLLVSAHLDSVLDVSAQELSAVLDGVVFLADQTLVFRFSVRVSGRWVHHRVMVSASTSQADDGESGAKPTVLGLKTSDAEVQPSADAAPVLIVAVVKAWATDHVVPSSAGWTRLDAERCHLESNGEILEVLQSSFPLDPLLPSRC